MKLENIEHKILSATKWSTATELISKILTPVTTIILARLLAPDAFGVVATATMIFSFADMFTDAGFQKYLVQHEFEDDEEKNKFTTVAFWTNLWLSLFLLTVVIVFSNQIARLVGNPGLGIVIIVACCALPLTSFSSIQRALFRRELDYKLLFHTRIIGICIPFVITIPLALLGFSYWSLIIGNLCGEVMNAAMLTLKSRWKPSLYYSRKILKKMISFSVWSLVEQVSIWLTSWLDVFLVGALLNVYYLGLYKTAMSTVGSIMSIITGSITSVLFSTLSRLQNNDADFRKTYLDFQRLVGLFILPLGAGIFLYRNLVTEVILGRQWIEASQFIGLWGLMSAITIVFSYFSSEAYRAKGKPKLSLLVQILHLVVLIPALLISIHYGYDALIYTRSLIRIQLILVNFIIMYLVIKISPLQMIKNVFPFCVGVAVIITAALGLQQISSGTLWNIVSILLCVVVYFATILVFPKSRIELFVLIDKFIFKKQKSLLKSGTEKNNINEI